MKAVRVCLCLLVAFAVVSLGGVEPWGVAILELGVAALLAAWAVTAVRRRMVEIHGNWLYLPLTGLAILALAQSALRLSVYPYATKFELLGWAAGAIFFFLAVQSFRTTAHRKRFAWFLVSLAFVVSLFGIVQHFAFDGKLFWLLPLPAGATPFGPFIDHDHFAGFVELALGPGLALLLFSGVAREKRVLLSLFTVVPMGALALSASRGGILAFAIEFLLLGAFAWRYAKSSRAAAATGLAAVACLVVLWLGVGHTVKRFEKTTVASQMRPEGRLTIYRGAWRIFLAHPWTGTGLGTFETMYPRYETAYSPAVVNHAHNDFIELLTDTGVAGALCGLVFLVVLFRLGLQNLRASESRVDRALHAGALAGCTGLLAHSLVDFNLHVPSNALLFLLLAALAATRGTAAGAQQTHRTRSAVSSSAQARP